MSLVRNTPEFSVQQAAELVSKIYGIRGDATPLPSERDQNFRIESETGERFVFKIANGGEHRETLEAENRAMLHADRHGALCPRVIPASSGDFISKIPTADGGSHFIRLISFLPGVPMGSVQRHTSELLNSLGRCVGRIDRAFADFDHPAVHRTFHWDLAHGLAVVERHRPLVADERIGALIDEWVDGFRHRVVHLLPGLRKSVIHNDANDYNVIVGNGDDTDLHARNQRVVGIVDFGDMVYSYTVCNPAIAIAYAILDKPDPLSVAADILSGYHGAFPLREREVEALFGLIGLRLCQSACLAAYQQQQQPDNPYLDISQAPIRRTLPKWAEIDPGFAHAAFRHTCGWTPYPAGEAVVRSLGAGKENPYPIFGEDLPAESWVVLDLGPAGSVATGDPELPDAPAIKQRIRRELDTAGATVGFGRYDEPRLPCTRLDGGNGLVSEETVYLGTELFASPGTPVHAPLAGRVAEADIAPESPPMGPGNVLLLEHGTDESGTFFTRYRNIAEVPACLRETGYAVGKGAQIGVLAGDKEMGESVSGLRFQVMTGLLDCGIDFPSFCSTRHRHIWRCFSPDPNAILKIPAHRFPEFPMDKAALLSGRQKHFAGNLKIGYRNPLKIERGWMQYLYDDGGRRYLDAYNNVPHVGHCHPRVVDAAKRQMGILNTNTRYLSDLLNRYADRLCATMPDPLSVCFFVNSASEGNELALRLARTYTGARDLIVLEGAYHGNTNALIDISPYKHDGPGGTGAPEWVHCAPVADTFRGAYRAEDPDAAAKYARHVVRLVERIAAKGRHLCGFMAESCPSVGGQIFFPDGYLARVHRTIHEAGGVFMVDEVQTAYGRLGTHFYGFQTQGVVPDIVVLGKPIGNGHPIGAVVTTPDIAASFNTGMEFFSTFGGNTVSCAVGLAVLEVMESENLQQNALSAGDRLLAGLNRLKDKYAIIGDVRGAGLFVGIELVRNRKTLEPAGAEAAFIADRMRDLGVLLGTDGPYHNVIKIRPPMPFSMDDADLLAAVLGRILAEDF